MPYGRNVLPDWLKVIAIEYYVNPTGRITKDKNLPKHALCP